MPSTPVKLRRRRQTATSESVNQGSVKGILAGLGRMRRCWAVVADTDSCTLLALSSMYPPMPVIVGVPRSGTTLLRIMLDAHPDLAIPPETGFLPQLAALDIVAESGRAACETILGSETWPDFHLEAPAFEREIARLSPCTPLTSRGRSTECTHRGLARHAGGQDADLRNGDRPDRRAAAGSPRHPYHS